MKSGGGGGAGGMVVLMAGDGIVMHTKGETFANRDYDFAISADGGACRTSPAFTLLIRDKYPANGQPTIEGSLYDSVPLGGFGGMGLVQLHAWPADLEGSEPGSYVGADNQLLTRANARIGFAFHRDPELAVPGFDPARFPPKQGAFLFDLSDAATRPQTHCPQ